MESLAAHEAFEVSVLQWLKSKDLLRPLVFGGGTMLRLCHDLPRYSLDVDFWFLKLLDFDEFYRRLEDAMRQEYDVRDMQNKFYSILVEIRNVAGMPKLKIEIRKAVAASGSTEEKIAFSPHFPTQVLVRGFTLKQMCSNKILALLERGEIRDAFDLEFLARKGVTLELTEVKTRELLKKLRGFNKRDFSVKLGSVLVPEVRDYYKDRRFAYLEEQLTFEKWAT